MTDTLSRIAMLNDRVRLGLDRNARIVITATCLAALAGDGGIVREALVQAEVLGAVRRYVFTSGWSGARTRRVRRRRDDGPLQDRLL